MNKIPDEVLHFLTSQGFTVVTTIDKTGTPHASCKGIVKIDDKGIIYLLDLYKARTYDNLKRDDHIAITAVDEHRFKGYSLKGRAKIIKPKDISPAILKAWHQKVTGRISKRLLRNMQGQKGHSAHPEAILPDPEYLIAVEVGSIVDLTPHALK